MPEIEFVDPDSSTGVDEELDTGPRHAAPQTPRGGRRITAVAAAVVVAGAVLVGVLHRGGSGRPAVSSTFSADAVRAPEAPVSAFRVDHLGGDAPEGARPGTLAGDTPTFTPTPTTVDALPVCPDPDACRNDLFIPARVAVAVRAHLPAANGIDGSSVVVLGTHPTLRFREVTARDGRLTVRIRIDGAVVGDTVPVVSTPGGGTSVTAFAKAGAFEIFVTAAGPDSAIPSASTLRALAEDRRLLIVG